MDFRFYRLKYELRTAFKGQVLDDFIADFTLGTIEYSDQLEGWVLNIDEASNNKGAGIKIVLTTPMRSIIEQSFTLSFPVSNSKAEYEAVLARLRMAITLRVTWLEIRCDSSLVVNEVSGEYVTRDSRMAEYLQLVLKLKSKIS